MQDVDGFLELGDVYHAVDAARVLDAMGVWPSVPTSDRAGADFMGAF